MTVHGTRRSGWCLSGQCAPICPSKSCPCDCHPDRTRENAAPEPTPED